MRCLVGGAHEGNVWRARVVIEAQFAADLGILRTDGTVRDDQKSRQISYALTAAVSGAAWSGLALLFESMAPEPIPFPALLVCGVFTGLAVSYVFRSAFRHARAPRELLLPLMTVPFAVLLFGSLVWLARLSTGYHFHSRAMLPGEELTLILSGYVFYGLLSPLFTPVLYVVALANQGIMHLILQASVEQ
jgi:hypothetical protein